jgi:hypothetical protein
MSTPRVLELTSDDVRYLCVRWEVARGTVYGHLTKHDYGRSIIQAIHLMTTLNAKYILVPEGEERG